MLVIELACLRGVGNEFIIKEGGLVWVGGLQNESESMQTLLFQSPYSESLVPEYIRKTNRWITNNLHKISWEDGYIPYSQMPATLSQFSKGWGPIFTKGSEKAQFLSTILGEKVFDLDDFDCPKADELALPLMTTCLVGHTKHCALFKALRYAKWLSCAKPTHPINVSGVFKHPMAC